MGSDPLVFEGNHLGGGSGNTIYVDEGTTALTTAAAVDALTDMTVSGTSTTSCSTPPSGP